MGRLFTQLFCLVLLIPQTAMADTTPLRLATTTSTENSGLLRHLLPPFTKRTGIEVHVLAVGTGKALQLGRNGDVDVVLVHAPQAEQDFIDSGAGVNRRNVMYNDFVLVGPKSDPAGIAGVQDAAAALQRISETGSTFVSRGDDSGTHKQEQSLWKSAGVTPSGNWYREAGQGMEAVLQMAGELGGYTLTDRGTWIAFRHQSPLRIVVEGDQRLFNPYGIIAVNPDRYPDTHYIGAMHLIAWLTSIEGQAMIRGYRINDEQLFVPVAVSPSDEDSWRISGTPSNRP